MRCKICGELHSLNEGTIIKGSNHTYFVCNDCEPDNYVICDDCGELIHEDDSCYTTYDGRTICGNCYTDGYFMCERCGKVLPDYDVVHIEDTEEYVCNDCAENYYCQCMDCGKWYSTYTTISDNANNYLCGDCYGDSYYTCTNCGCFVHITDCYWGDMNNEPYCEDCYNDLHLSDIYERHNFNDYEVRYSKLDKHREPTRVLIGLEIEVEGSINYATEFLDSHSNMRDMVHLELDSSIDGFEIVTQPMTKNYVNYEFRQCIDKGLDFLKRHNFKGHNCGGIHIHVSEYGSRELAVYRLKRLLYNLDSKQQELFLKLTQRKSGDLCAWATNEVDYDIYTGHSDYQDSRYEAINLDKRTRTLEFRVFNSSLRIERIFKNIEMVYALLDYINSTSWNSSSDLYDWIRFVCDNNVLYPNLYLFIEEKQLREKYRRPILKMYSSAA